MTWRERRLSTCWSLESNASHDPVEETGGSGAKHASATPSRSRWP